jgi:hypothetical protein
VDRHAARLRDDTAEKLGDQTATIFALPMVTSVGYPFVDIDNGGTLEGLLAGLSETIALCGENTKVVPGHGPIVNRNAVIAQRDLVVAIRDRMLPLIATGMSFDQVLAANLTAGYQLTTSGGAETADQFIWWMYVELSAR